MRLVKGSLYFYEQYIYNNVQQEVSKKKKSKSSVLYMNYESILRIDSYCT